MDIVNKAISKASDLASEATWNAQQRIKISTEERRLDDLHAKAMEKRAEIGEAMFKLWQAHKLPPSQLDGLFYELQDILDAVGAATVHVDHLKAETYAQATRAQTQTSTSYAAAVPQPPQLPPSPRGYGTAPALPAGPEAAGHQAPIVIDGAPAVPLTECPSCHTMVRADRNFCGHCGRPLSS